MAVRDTTRSVRLLLLCSRSDDRRFRAAARATFCRTCRARACDHARNVLRGRRLFQRASQSTGSRYFEMELTSHKPPTTPGTFSGLPRPQRSLLRLFASPMRSARSCGLKPQQCPETFFLFGGTGPLLGRAKHIGSLGIGEHVTFLGTVPDMSTLYTAAGLVMLTSSKEFTPNVLIEAQATGISVVATPGFSSMEAVGEGVTGLSIRPIARH
jgi:hypothetical protein